jgi:hypothetical protein
MDNPAFYILTYILATIAVIILITDSGLCIWSYTNPTLKYVNPDATGDVSFVEVDSFEKKNSITVTEKYTDSVPSNEQASPIAGTDKTCVPLYTADPLITANCFLHTDQGCNGVGADNKIDPEKLDGGYVTSKGWKQTCVAENRASYMSDEPSPTHEPQNFNECNS